jgi:hypothetical protein
MILEFVEQYLRQEAEKRLETPNNREGCFDLIGKRLWGQT